MAKDHGQGIFTMEVIGSIAAAAKEPLEAQKAIAIKAIDESTATMQNQLKARGMVHAAHSHKALMLGMANYSLSHQGMKTFR